MTRTRNAHPRVRADLGRPVRILLVEDSPSDALMTVTALREGRIVNDLTVVTDGEAALRLLRREAEHASVDVPDLIILDLNLPKVDGRVVLQEIKADPELMLIPVVILTTSAADEDITRSYQLHANAYVTKPVALDEFLAAIADIEGFWISLVRLPAAPTIGRQAVSSHDPPG